MLLGVVGCHEEKQIPVAPAGSLVVEDSRSVVRLNNELDSFDVTFKSSLDWHITTTGSAFSVTPTEGVGSEEPQTITISTLKENVSEKSVTRGSVAICLKGYSTKHQIKVEQCAKPERTILAYFFGTSLSYYFGINIDCMKKALAEDILGNDRLLVFVQTSRNKAVIKELYHDNSLNEALENVICEVAIPSMLKAEQFGENLLQLMEIAPADRYAMIVGGHSTAWLPSTPSSGGGTPLKADYGYIPKWSPAAGAEVTRTIGENNVKLDIEDFATGLSVTNQVFDWIYFDVCFMSSLEASYALRNHAKYVVGSPCEIMGYGSPFDLLLDELVADDLDGACRTYKNYYANEYYGSNSGCIATIVCEELEPLTEIVKLLNNTSVAEDLDIWSLQTYEGRSAHVFFDVENYMISAYGNNPTVEAFSSQLDKTVINRYHTEKFYSTYNAQMNDINYYSGISFTPNEDCIEVLERQAESGMSGSTKLTDAEISLMREQIAELKYYLPSLQKTEWYKDTH